MMMSDHSVGLGLAWFEVSDAEGEPVILGSLWETKPVALVFLRHYG